MRRYLSIVRGTFLDSLAFRVNFLFIVLGSLAALVVAYYLWQAVYAGSGGVLNGLSFIQAFSYIAVSGCIFTMIGTNVEYELSGRIGRGGIVMDLILPMDLYLMTLSSSLGIFLFRFVFSGVPLIALMALVFQVPVTWGINLLFFMVSLCLSFLISFNFDFMAGVTVFSFESVWGLKMIKDALILFFSGAVIPIAFFPKEVQAVLMVLPFQAMYYTPVTLLLGGRSIADSLLMLLVQAGWIAFFAAAGRLFHKRILAKLTIAGG